MEWRRTDELDQRNISKWLIEDVTGGVLAALVVWQLFRVPISLSLPLLIPILAPVQGSRWTKNPSTLVSWNQLAILVLLVRCCPVTLTKRTGIDPRGAIGAYKKVCNVDRENQEIRKNLARSGSSWGLSPTWHFCLFWEGSQEAQGSDACCGSSHQCHPQ